MCQILLSDLFPGLQIQYKFENVFTVIFHSVASHYCRNNRMISFLAKFLDRLLK